MTMLQAVVPAIMVAAGVVVMEGQAAEVQATLVV
jgi:hypothetical protein